MDSNEEIKRLRMALQSSEKIQAELDKTVFSLKTLHDISAEISSLYKPLEINIGINSGPALVGAARYDSLAGSRWTYTARGSLVNVAARIGAMAKGGQTYLSKETAERVMGEIDLKNVGYFTFKNVKDKVEIYQLL